MEPEPTLERSSSSITVMQNVYLVTSVLFSCLGLLHAAHQVPTNDCPSPCTCAPFQGVKWAYCNATGISSVPRGIPVETEVLELSTNHIRHIPKDALKGLVNLREVYVEMNGLVEGDIEIGAFDLPKLDTIGLGNNEYTTVPKCLPKQLTRFYFWYNKLETLAEDSFQSCPLLEYFDFSNNRLTKVAEHAFDGLSNIDTIYLPFNNLSEKSFPPNLFAKNTKLQLVSLRFNQFRHLWTDFPPQIPYIDYAGNQITTLPSFGFRSLPNILSMAFWQGQVTTIEDNAFSGLHKLTSIDFMQNEISSRITNLTFAGLTGLTSLVMPINNVSHIDPGAFHMMYSVTELWLSDMKLTKLEPEVLNVKYMPHLSVLYIDGNPWFCDCHLRWLREKMNNATYTIQDPHLITCAGPSKVVGKAWDILTPEQFVCN